MQLESQLKVVTISIVLIVGLIFFLFAYSAITTPRTQTTATVLTIQRDSAHDIRLRVRFQQYRDHAVITQTWTWSQVPWAYSALPQTPLTGILALNDLGHPVAITLPHFRKVIHLPSYSGFWSQSRALWSAFLKFWSFRRRRV